ncbi:trk system potassium uptake protein TrkH [Mariniphaga anaerophila]|uniref:Trk system potassium uptake protein TrkH n=1 Tax=Mariniphaga anaerophila TaxID=1484053 RepID=A0A1M4TIL7_9BACT|nr:TrkH family potassium uptake protein [Mariniphaga anaerophila]SHE44258.1 trk system potassium uptake protein TrkH [Mariniphaga anaerophila]
MLKSDTYKIVFKQIGSLFILQGIVMAIPAIVALIYHEGYSVAGFVGSALFTSGLGFFLYQKYFQAEDPQYNHAFIIAAAGWLAITFLGGLPLFVIAYITPAEIMNQFIPSGSDYAISSLVYFKNPLHCFFESMSAYTTTGLTMAIHEPSVGKGILFYRSLAQWVGGAGFIVMVLAIFKQRSGQSAMLLFGVESTGEKLKTKVIETARAIWKVYLLLTIFSAVYLFIGTSLILPDYPLGENIFDSINHAMTGQSTGGFSTLDDSIAGYNSPFMDMLYLLPMILGSFSIPFFYKFIFEKKFSELWKDIQTRSLIIAFVGGSAVLSFLLYKADVVSEPVREGTFQFISAMSTTGWQTSNIGNWDWLSILFVVGAAMFVGGASGATVGGIKMIRALVIKKGLFWQVKKAFFSEHTIKVVKFNGKSLSSAEMNEEFTKAASLAIIFLLMIIVSSVVATFFIGSDYDFFDALFEATSAQATVGLSSGICEPGMSPVLESIYIFQMWAGRLEIIPVLALIRAIFLGTVLWKH